MTFDWQKFKSQKRKIIPFYVMVFMLLVSIFADFIANNKPLLLKYNGRYHFPILEYLSDQDLGGSFVSPADFNDEFIKAQVAQNGWMIMPPVQYYYDNVVSNLSSSAPSPPYGNNFLGTDSQGRDILARLIHSTRFSLIFGLTVTMITMVIALFFGSIQGYFGGYVDLIMQRCIEIWANFPILYILIILSTIIIPNTFSIMFILLLFSWMGLASMVRAEFYKARSADYVIIAKTMGISDFRIMAKHILPNAMVATITSIPVILSSSIATLATLDFLGLGLSSIYPSLGEMLLQAKDNLHAPWIAVPTVTVLLTMLLSLTILSESLREYYK